MRILKDAKPVSVGGRARNDGVDFYGDNYKVSFTIKNDQSVSISDEKQPIRGRIDSLLGNIPILRTIALILRMPIVAIMVSVAVAIDVTTRGELGAMQLGENFVRLLTIGLLIVSLICFAYVFKTSIWRIKQVWRFHGAEHKTIFAVRNDIPLELDMVRECPRVSERCGTNLVIFLVPFSALLMVAANYVYVLSFESIKYLAIFTLSYEFFCIENGDKKPILKYLYRVGFWLQQKIFTAEPDDAQLLAAISAVKTLVGLEQAIEEK